MPDDALPEDSLVGRLLNPKPQEITGDGTGETLPPFSDKPRYAKPLPLWRVMHRAHMDADPFNNTRGYAAEIEALRDWLPDMPPREFIKQWCRQYGNYDYTMVRNTMEWVCALLTEQARIAREGK